MSHKPKKKCLECGKKISAVAGDLCFMCGFNKAKKQRFLKSVLKK
jgi:ribosomal protein L37E